MKKIYYELISGAFMIWKSKLLKRMRIVALLILITMTQTFAIDSYAQSKRLSLNFKNEKIIDILDEIEEQSEFYFMFDASKIDVNQRKSIDCENQAITSILDQLFEKTGITYRISDRQIGLISTKFANSEQEMAVSGKVTDASSRPLPGVTVVVKGTTQGTVTNADGQYSLMGIPDNAILQFSFVGMKTQEIPVSGKANINVTLVEDAIGIEEVVAIGYGTIKKVNLTGSISSVSSNTLVERSVTNVGNLLQGRIPGLQVIQSSGLPGRDNAIIKIRGMGSFGASSDPLILVDGVVGSLSNIAPNDIESISVLKDAASASVYGARAANGVILVTTKQANKGTHFEYQLDMGVDNATTLPNLITNSAEYMEMFNSARQRSGLGLLYTQAQIDAYKNATDREQYPNFDWVDYYFNPAKDINHYLSFSNVTDKSFFKCSFNYHDQDGILPNINLKKYNIQLNFKNQITKSIRFGVSIGGMYSDNIAPWMNPGHSGSIVHGGVYQNAPLYKPFLPDGSGRKVAWAYPNEPHDVEAPEVFDDVKQRDNNYALNGQIYLDIDLFEGLVWTTKAALDYADNKSKLRIISTQDHYFYQKQPGQADYSLCSVATIAPQLTDRFTRNILPTVSSVLNYETHIGENHNLRAMVGFEQQSSLSQYITGTRKIFPTNGLSELNAGSTSGQSLGGSASEWALRGFFGRIGYDFQGKYLIEINSRYDETSRVEEANRWGFFPSISAGWRISEEKLFKEKFGWIDNFKLRGSYGTLGNQDIGNYPYQDILSLTSYSLNSQNVQGVLNTRLTDKKLRWESTKILDFGLDLDIKEGLFGMTFDWFKKNTLGILATMPVPISLGLKGPVTNNGELQNIGYDLELRHRNRLGQITYDVNFILSTFKNKVLYMVTPKKGINEVGLPYNSFYIYEMEGIFQSQADIDNSPAQDNNPKPGDIKIKDQNSDNIIDSKDKISISPYPDFTYSFGLNVSWKRFYLSTFFEGVEGQRRDISGWGYDPFHQGGSPNVRFRNAWSPTNPSNTIPAAYVAGYTGVSGYYNTYNLPDASYLRLKNIKLSYNLPKRIVEKIKLQDLSIYFSGDNLLTFTKFPQGLDPELTEASSGSTEHHITAGAYPQIRILNLGVNIKF